MQIRTVLSLLIPLAVALSMCKQNEEEFTALDTEWDGVIVGSWKLTEAGYSPGGGYITGQVSEENAFIMTFYEDLQFECEAKGFNQYNYYRTFTDEAGKTVAIAFFETQSESEEFADDLTRFEYLIQFENQLLKLRKWGCIEGCHLGFKKVIGNK